MKKLSTKNKIIKLISAFLIFLIIIPTILLPKPKQANAQWLVFDAGNFGQNVVNTSTTVKDWAKQILEQALMAVARKALQQVTQSTVNWINSGFHGNPLYIENSDSFFKDIAKSEVKLLVDIFGYDQLRYPFGRNFALNTINAYKSKLEDNAAYSLSSVMTDPVYLHAFQTDFNVGGWNGFLLNTQYPQNNYIGFTMLATEELARRVQGTTQTATQKVQQTLDRGMGFLSPQTCPSNQLYNNGFNEFNRPSFQSTIEYNPPQCEESDSPLCKSALENYNKEYEKKLAEEKAEWAKTNDCPGGLTATTPGSVVANQITTALTSGTRATELSTAMGSSLAAIFDTLLNKFISDGLNSLANIDSPSSNNDDNFDFEDPLITTPSNITVNVNEQVSATISGGQEPYFILTEPNPNMAITLFSGSNIVVAGLKVGQTAVVFKDSSSPAKIITTPILVTNNDNLTATPQDVFMLVQETANVTISGGVASYAIETPPDTKIATATISGSSLLISSIAPGQTSVIIKDSSSPSQTISINIQTVK